jgi:hypothetical protein
MARPLMLIALALGAGFLIGGCGGDGSTTVINRTVTESGAATQSTQTTTKEAKSDSAPLRHLTNFQSPSGNIGCVLLDGRARCDIKKRSWSAPPRPPGCPREVDFGQGLEVGRRDQSGAFVCAGDTALDPQAQRLAYGSDDRAGGLLCVSRTTGITCTNPNRHGFFISIQSYRAF